MANLTPAATFDSVYQFETTDLIQGGPGGTDNIPHQQLLNRTQWLFANKLALDGSQPMTGGLSINAGAGTALTLTTPNTVDTVIRMTQSAQTALTVKALAGGVMSIGVDTASGDTERVRINSSGNVGIGVGSAGNTLQLYKAGAVANYLHVTTGATGPGTGNGLLVGVDASGNGVINAQGAVSLQTFVAGGERMRIDSSGNVGVGTNSPAQRLHVNGEIQQENANYLRGKLAAGTATRLFGLNASNTLYIGGVDAAQSETLFVRNGATQMTIDASGNVGVGTSSPNNKFVVSNGGAAGFEFDPASGLLQTYNRSGGAYTEMLQYALQWRVLTGSSPTERMRIDSSGNVGIGGSPGRLLDVIGSTPTARVLGSAGTTAKLELVSAGVYSWSLSSLSSGPFTITQDATERLRIDTSGNFGIGRAPGVSLDVQSASAAIFRARGGSGAGQGAGLYITLPASDTTMAAFGDRATSFGGTPGNIASIYTSAGIPLTFDVAAAERMRINADGTVTLSGALSGTSGAFSGTINAASGSVTGSWTVGTTLTVTSSIIGNAVIKSSSSQGFHNEVPSGSSPVIRLQQNGNGDWRMQGVASSTALIFTENGNERARLGASGASATFSSGIATPTNSLGTTSGTVTVNCALSNVHAVTLNGNMTLALSNPSDGQTINVFITQDGTGGRTATWPSSVKWPSASAGSLSTGANAVDLLVLTYRSATGFYYASLLKAFG